MRSKLLTLKSGLLAFIAFFALALISVGLCFVPHAAADEGDEPTEPVYAYDKLEWQYKSGDAGDAWTTITESNKPEFEFALQDGSKTDGVNYADRIQAVLTKDGTETTVTAADSGLKLQFMAAGANTASETFSDAGTYTVSISGVDEGKEVAAENATLELTIAPKTLNLNGISGRAGFWKVQSGSDKYSLLDGTNVIYFTQETIIVDGEEKIHINSNRGGDANNPNPETYARWTGEAIELIYNDEFTFDDPFVSGATTNMSALLAYVDAGNISSENKSAVGTQYDNTVINTTITIDFGSNYVLDNAENSTQLVLSKTWNIVTIGNTLRINEAGDSFGEIASELNATYATDVTVKSPRPEHGDTVYWTLYELVSMPVDGDEAELTEETLVRRPRETFAVKFTENGATETVYAWDGKEYTLGAATDKTFGSYFEGLEVGTYDLEGYVPDYTASSAEDAWWDQNGLGCDQGAQFFAFSQTLTFSVEQLDLEEAGDERISIVIGPNNAYNGEEGAQPSENTEVYFDGKKLVFGEDYTLAYENNVNVGNDARLIVMGLGNFKGEVSTTFTIVQADNRWTVTPNVMRWTYGGFGKTINTFIATPAFGSVTDVLFMIYTDSLCTKPVESLKDGFTVNANGEVSDAVETELNKLARGMYYLVCTVGETDNYREISTRLAFNILQANNTWVVNPSIKSWTEGAYDKEENAVIAEALFGNDGLSVYVYNAANEVVYEQNGSFVRVNNLDTLGNGIYTLTARVAGTNDYVGLASFTFTFQVFEKPGLPWWAVLLIVVGVLAVIAIVLVILWKVGVLTLLTDKITLNIRTQATIDATIAAIRANKRAEEAKVAVAAAKAKEKSAERKAAAAAERAKPVEEKAAALEAKAKAQAERAERMKAKAEAMQARAEKMREKALEEQAAPAAEAAAASEPEQPASPETTDTQSDN